MLLTLTEAKVIHIETAAQTTTNRAFSAHHKRLLVSRPLADMRKPNDDTYPKVLNRRPFLYQFAVEYI